MLKGDPKIESSLEELISSIKNSEIYRTGIMVRPSKVYLPVKRSAESRDYRNVLMNTGETTFYCSKITKGRNCCRSWKLLNWKQQLSARKRLWINSFAPRGILSG